MIRIYTAPSCASCRKVKAWLKEHDIPYVEKNIFYTILREDELRELLERSENGTDDIISKRSKIIKENKVDIEDMSTNELIHFIQKNPSILKRPIMIDERRFQVGQNVRSLTIVRNSVHLHLWKTIITIKKQAYRPAFNVLRTLAILLAQFALYCR